MTAPAANVLAEMGAPAYAVLDGARDDRVRRWVFDTRAPRWCLYRGRLIPQVEDAAPWLLRLVPGAPYVDEFFARFWGQSWGILLASSAPVAAVRRQLRMRLLARTEDHRTLLFRYYDPRVLRVYLPTCTPAEMAAFFGVIEAFAAEGEDGAAIVFRRGEPHPPARPLLMRSEQQATLAAALRERFARQVARHLQDSFPLLCDAMGDDRVRQTVADGFGKAFDHGLRTERDLCRFVDLMFVHGDRFDTEAPWAAMLRDEQIADPSARLDSIYLLDRKLREARSQ